MLQHLSHVQGLATGKTLNQTSNTSLFHATTTLRFFNELNWSEYFPYLNQPWEEIYQLRPPRPRSTHGVHYAIWILSMKSHAIWTYECTCNISAPIKKELGFQENLSLISTSVPSFFLANSTPAPNGLCVGSIFPSFEVSLQLCLMEHPIHLTTRWNTTRCQVDTMVDFPMWR